MAYTPSAIPDDTPPALKAWLADQLRQVALELNLRPRLTPQGVAPTRPQQGQLVYAVDPWATDLGGEGVYVFNGMTWEAL